MKYEPEVTTAVAIVEKTLKKKVFDGIDKEKAEAVLLCMVNDILELAVGIVSEARSAQ